MPEATTPDGRALASWLERLAALILDVIVLYLLGLLLSVVWGRDVLGNLARLAEGDAVPALPTSLFVARLLLPVVYFGGFLLWRQATPGKLLVGLRVQGVGAAGVGPRAATLRWVVLAGPSYVLLAFPPGLSIIGTLWILLDCLLPLRDRNNQALHDKAAGTYVVRR